jgi:hypothetical protein
MLEILEPWKLHRSSSMYFKPFGWFWCTLKLENHCCQNIRNINKKDSETRLKIDINKIQWNFTKVMEAREVFVLLVLFFNLFVFLRQDFIIYPRLALKLIYSLDWPQTPGLNASISWVQGWQTGTTMSCPREILGRLVEFGLRWDETGQSHLEGGRSLSFQGGN